ncbi:N-formylglutamate amidohydrolase [Roseovarius aestuarii]|uniref:N-formylglutamate amidohydrolase n=1 Tax=Roseovarius aestuarii TaxID=475083 RepID=A0A1X7BVV6_9RHOB|nr:N-formylglutamate amidohydrolase [Roseovarius aestuarii]SMC13645.1 N-formylglutamate amidohydrolase [Roseovarius aestuarii]
MSTSVRATGLLCQSDPEPVEWVNPGSTSPVLLVCEHAGQAVPRALGDLGLPDGAIDTHIGWDIGAEALARGIAARLDAPLILQRYSRLVIDCNRPPDSDSAIPAVSDTQPVPGNTGLGADARTARIHGVFDPLDAAVTAGFERHPRRAAFAIHSFTPALAGGPHRPWHAGFLTRRDMATAEALIAHIGRTEPTFELIANQPYQIDDDTDWFIPTHAEPRGMRHALVEIRNDQLRNAAGVEVWADLLSNAISALLETAP